MKLYAVILLCIQKFTYSSRHSIPLLAWNVLFTLSVNKIIIRTREGNSHCYSCILFPAQGQCQAMEALYRGMQLSQGPLPMKSA